MASRGSSPQHHGGGATAVELTLLAITKFHKLSLKSIETFSSSWLNRIFKYKFTYIYFISVVLVFLVIFSHLCPGGLKEFHLIIEGELRETRDLKHNQKFYFENSSESRPDLCQKKQSILLDVGYLLQILNSEV